MKLKLIFCLFALSSQSMASESYERFIGRDADEFKKEMRTWDSFLVGVSPHSDTKHGSTIFFTKSGDVLLTIEENSTPNEKKPKWKISGVQKLGTDKEGSYIAGSCYTDRGRDSRYVVLVDGKPERYRDYKQFQKIWKFDDQLKRFEPTSASILRCQFE